MNPDPTTVAYESAWRRQFASPNRRYWFNRLWRATPGNYAPWQWAVIERLRAEWKHRTPMEAAAKENE